MKALFLTSAQLDRFQTDARCGNDTTSAMAEFLLLQQCVAHCETLATELANHASDTPLFSQLSECIAASEAYLAGLSRESHYAPRLGAFCREVCTTTARLCGAEPSESARRCQQLCRSAARLLARHLPSALSN